jgi:hypothetical protein
MTQLPDDVESIGYKEVSPFQYEQVFSSKSKNFTGTEKEFVNAGYAYRYQQITKHRRLVQA